MVRYMEEIMRMNNMFLLDNTGILVRDKYATASKITLYIKMNSEQKLPVLYAQNGMLRITKRNMLRITKKQQPGEESSEEEEEEVGLY